MDKCYRLYSPGEVQRCLLCGKEYQPAVELAACPHSPKYRTILADPPWPMRMMPALQRRKLTPASLVYPTMSIDEICAMPVASLTAPGAHLWLWTVNQFLREAFNVMEAWGFKYLQTITWAKSSGCGNYFISQTEHCLFGYKDQCRFNRARYVPNVYHWPRATAGNHSRKPTGSYELIERVSDEPRLELFARPISPLFPKIEGWDTWGNEMEAEVDLTYHQEVELGR